MTLRELLRHNLSQVPIEDVEDACVSTVAAHLGVGCADVEKACPEFRLWIERALRGVCYEMVKNSGHIQE